jgi:hypothetical protein
MENNKPRTIDEFFIEKYQKLEEENQRLARDNETLSKNCHFYGEMIKNIKKDFEIKLKEYGTETKYITFNGSVWSNTEEEKFDKYLSFFNLETQIEEGENEDEQ